MVAGLLADLQDLQAREFTADVPVDLEPYGLTVPQVIVTLKGTATNIVAQLLLGGLDGAGLQYAKLATEPFVYAVDAALAEQLPTHPPALFARRLATLEAGQVTRLVLERAGERTVLERDADQTWKLLEPTSGVLDVDGLQALVNALVEIRAVEFLPDSPAEPVACGLDNPALTIAATTAEKNYVLKIGFTADGETYCAWWSDPESLFMVSAATVATLQKTVLQVVPPPAALPAEPPPAAP